MKLYIYVWLYYFMIGVFLYWGLFFFFEGFLYRYLKGFYDILI